MQMGALNDRDSAITLHNGRCSHDAPLAGTELGEFELLSFDQRRSLGRTIQALWPMPAYEGLRKYLIARSEVLEGLRRHGKVLSDVPVRDAALPSDIPSCRGRESQDRFLAEIDQDGFAFALAPSDIAYFNRRTHKLPRYRYRIDVVVRNGRVCVRKQFVRGPWRRNLARWWFWNLLGLPFYNAAAALLRLRGLPGIPAIHEIEPLTRTIYMDYVQGENLRQHVGRIGYAIHDADLAADPSLCRLSGSERDRRERRMFSQVIGRNLAGQIEGLVRAMNSRGVAPQDIKMGNVMIGAKSGCLYWIDFERALLSSFDGWEKSSQKQSRLLKEWFDLDVTFADE